MCQQWPADIHQCRIWLMASNFWGDDPIQLPQKILPPFPRAVEQRIPRIPLNWLLLNRSKGTHGAEKDKALGLENDQAPDVPVQIEPEKRLLYGDSEQKIDSLYGF